MKKLRAELILSCLLLFLTSCATSRTYKCYEGPVKPKANVATILTQHWAYTWVNLYRDQKRLNSTADITGAAQLEITPGIVTMVTRANMASFMGAQTAENLSKVTFEPEAGRTYFIECVFTQIRPKWMGKFIVHDVSDITPAERRAMMEKHP